MDWSLRSSSLGQKYMEPESEQEGKARCVSQLIYSYGFLRDCLLNLFLYFCMEWLADPRLDVLVYLGMLIS